MSANGYYIWRVSGFESGAAERFTGVWRKTSLGEGWTHHGMGAQGFDAEEINAESQGYRLAFVDAYNLGADTFYNAAWVRYGGLGTTRLGTIGTAVQNWMDARNIPGLSLAISHEGHLIYARGFGYADTSANKVAHSRHRWRIASTSKTICAVSALRALEDSATWNLDSKAFGAGALFGTDYGTAAYSAGEKQITLREIMTMTAGWNSQGRLSFVRHRSRQDHRLPTRQRAPGMDAGHGGLLQQLQLPGRRPHPGEDLRPAFPRLRPGPGLRPLRDDLADLGRADRGRPDGR
jgi:CubicO group peptidase (beta-lactamase class C family)